MRHNEVPRHLAEKAAQIGFDHENAGKRDDGKGGRPPDWNSLSDDDREERVRIAGYMLASAGEEIIGANISRDPPADMAVGMGQPKDLTGDPDKSSGAQEVGKRRAADAPVDVEAEAREKQLKDKQFQAEADKAAAENERERERKTKEENARIAGLKPIDKHPPGGTNDPAGKSAAPNPTGMNQTQVGKPKAK